MRQIRIGTFRLGDENVDLYVLPDSDSGGDFYLRPDDKNVGRIKIGIKEQYWDDVLSVLLHESFEYLACRFFVRYKTTQKFNFDHADYLFVFNHGTFGEILSRQALFLSQCLTKVHAKWKQHRPKKM